MQNKNMKKFIQLFQVKRDEWCASAIALVVFIILHAMFIYKYYEVFTQTGRGHWNIFVKHFNMSGFDVITYSMVTYWEPNYNVYRHPLLSFMVWPLSCLDKWLADLTGMNLVQFIMAVPLLLCAFYSFVFLYRIFKEIIQLRKADCMLLSAFFFSLAYIMLSVFVPDHFGISLFLLLFTIYLAGSKMQRGVPFKLWQTLVLFFLTAGVTLSNGVKTYLYVLFTNGWRFLCRVVALCLDMGLCPLGISHFCMAQGDGPQRNQSQEVCRAAGKSLESIQRHDEHQGHDRTEEGV